MDIIDGFAYLMGNGTALGFVAAGAFVGVVVGAVPGLTAAAAIAMLMPLTYYLDPLSALAFLYVIGKSGRYGGSIAAILFNTPGTAAAAATVQDGYALTRAGKSGKALKVATVSSVFGDIVGDLILIFGAAVIASYTSRLGPPEYFAVFMMAFLVIGSVVSNSVYKGIVSTLLGAVVSLVGFDPITGSSRLTLDIYVLGDGISLVPLLIGMFVISEVLSRSAQLSNPRSASVRAKAMDPRDQKLHWREFKQIIFILLRSSGVGAIIGVFPGLGSSVASFVAYGEERRRSHSPDKWGSGIIEGVAAPEAANNAVSGPSMIPLLTLGIPGSTIAAILVGVFLVHGIQVGPSIFETSHELVYGLFAAGLLGIVCYGIIGYWGAPTVGRVVAYIPESSLYPFIFLTALIAAYSTQQSLPDVCIALFFGVIGYLFRKFEFSIPAFIIAFVLTGGAEEAYWQSLLLSNNGHWIFLERPVALVLFGIGLLVLVLRSVSPSNLKALFAR